MSSYTHKGLGMSTTSGTSSRIVKFGEYRFDLENSTLYRGNEPVILPRKRAEVFRLLAERAGNIVRKEEIIERVWPEQFVDENNLTLQIFRSSSCAVIWRVSRRVRCIY
jgi:DNA-binding winged helix-turn-helix (wHTH) protein